MFVLHHVLDEGEGLNSFAEAHFVGENAAETVFGQEVQVGETLHLVASELGVETLRGGNGFDFLEGMNSLPEFDPVGIGLRFRHVVEESVQHGRLELFETLLRGF